MLSANNLFLFNKPLAESTLEAMRTQGAPKILTDTQLAWRDCVVSDLLFTLDNDFLRLHAQGRTHAGIAYCKQGTRSIGKMLCALVVIYEAMNADEVSGQVLFL